ncbi:methionyl-trna beta subunit [Vairimorpha apis BRL 01]|uniref:Methionyl-trna beta subunit n=1 Tax=Vairimorpha apis BRL 01 TaxID=1037528 RepID=T0MFS4_9MICR|nr:methionyl-trna beta subunit [Vairimorpha apis BRL 01]
MLVKYSKGFKDIMFALKHFENNLKTLEISEGFEICDENISYKESQQSIDFLVQKYKITGNLKKVRDKQQIPIDNSFLSYISLYVYYFDLITKTNLKNIIYTQEMLEKYNYNYLLFYLLQIQVGKIIDVKEVEDSNKLYIETVNTGKTLQIVSGIKELYSKEEIQNKKCLFITNIKSSKIRGIKSEGMILCARNDSNVEILFVDDMIEEGSRIYIDQKHDIIEIDQVGTIDLKKEFYKNIFNKLSIKNGFLNYDGFCVKIKEQNVKTGILEGIIS